MEVSLALLADYANVTREGKLNLLGLFDRIDARAVPWVHPQMQLVLQNERSGCIGGGTWKAKLTNT